MALFNEKIALFIKGRRSVFKDLKEAISENDSVVWMHCASLGEFEQGRPIIEKIRIQQPTSKIVLTFFSPSGYEVRKNYKLADVVCYLPLDTTQNAKQFMNLVHPNVAIFVKYEFWPIILKELKSNQIKTILISGIFRKNQVFFKWYGGWMRKSLKAFDQFFVQDKQSELLLKSIHFNNISVSGDTRFDRVLEISKQDNQLDFIEEFKNDACVLVAGSTWKEDEDLLVNYINNDLLNHQKVIIAPHNINTEAILKLKKSIDKNDSCVLVAGSHSLKKYQVFIIDTVGILTKIYSYADLAYVGGGYTKSGVHNVLEPASFGVPIIIGPNYQKFNEVIELVNLNGCFSVNSYPSLALLLNRFFNDQSERQEIGNKALKYVEDKTGATQQILNYLK